MKGADVALFLSKSGICALTTQAGPIGLIKSLCKSTTRVKAFTGCFYV